MMFDLSHALDESAPRCAGHPIFACHPIMTLEKDGMSVHTLTMGSHTGTHIDAPYHFIKEGRTVDQIDLHMLVGPAVVVDVRGRQGHGRIRWSDVEKYASRFHAGVVVLFCTGWSKYWGQPNYQNHPFLDKEVVERLVAAGVRVIGLDALSPDEIPAREGDEENFDCHRVILGNGGAIAENLNRLEELIGLKDVTVSLLPLKIVGCDGSPIRAVAWSSRNTC